MSVKRYVAEDMRQALKQIRDEQGPDAVILSNRRVEGGVEIVISLDGDLDWQQSQRAAAPHDEITCTAQGKSRSLDDEPVVELKSAQQPKPLDQTNSSVQDQATVNSGQAQVDATFEHLMSRYRQSPPSQNDEQLLIAMRSEIENLRLLLKDQMNHAIDERWAMKNPLEVAIMQRFEVQGLSSKLAKKLAIQSGSHTTVDECWQAALESLAAAIPVMDCKLIDKGGVVALLGATGVGKTTTIAKLAIRYALKYGKSQLALVTTDSYRLAAYEQLRTLGRILDVPVRLVDENSSLNEVLFSLRQKTMVLIDTAGFHPGDEERVQQLQLLERARTPIHKLLVLPSTSQSQVLSGVYELMKDIQLDGCVLSKVDEASSLGEVLSLVVEKQLPVAYITDGQKIPDDIGKACPEKLVRSLCGKNTSLGDWDKNPDEAQPVTAVRSNAPVNKIKKPVPVFARQHA